MVETCQRSRWIKVLVAFVVVVIIDIRHLIHFCTMLHVIGNSCTAILDDGISRSHGVIIIFFFIVLPLSTIEIHHTIDNNLSTNLKLLIYILLPILQLELNHWQR